MKKRVLLICALFAVLSFAVLQFFLYVDVYLAVKITVAVVAAVIFGIVILITYSGRGTGGQEDDWAEADEQVTHFMPSDDEGEYYGHEKKTSKSALRSNIDSDAEMSYMAPGDGSDIAPYAKFRGKNRTKKRGYIICALLVFTALFLAVLLVYMYADVDLIIKISIAVLAAVIFIVFVMYSYKGASRHEYYTEKDPGEQITRFVLMSENGAREKEWYVSGANGFLIGKGTAGGEVDIELGDTQYSDYVSREHAVLNFVKGFWYIEDLSSKSGVGLKKKGKDFALRLKPEVLYKVDVGDVIYISKVRIMVM